MRLCLNASLVVVALVLVGCGGKALPGQSQVDHVLARDVSRPAYIQALRLFEAQNPGADTTQPKCKHIQVVNTLVTEKQLTSKSPWSEVWMVQICGQAYPVAISFVPDAVGSGTSYKVHGTPQAATMAPQQGVQPQALPPVPATAPAVAPPAQAMPVSPHVVR